MIEYYATFAAGMVVGYLLAVRQVNKTLDAEIDKRIKQAKEAQL